MTKSNLILGMGEEEHEIEQALRDLHAAGTDIVTITQYLRPSTRHHPIARWVHPEEFVHWSDLARELGFAGVMAGPLVRSTYRAGRLWAKAMASVGREIQRRRNLRGRRPGRSSPGSAPAPSRAPTPYPERHGT